MSFEPQKFFIGVVDFFSVLLPGALLTYLTMDDIGPALLGDRYLKLVDAEAWLAFLFSSYLLGHFIFLLGSRLLDDQVYDRIRNATDGQRIARLANGKRLSRGLTRWLAAGLIPKVSDLAVSQAVRIKEHYLDPLTGSTSVNAFQWCKARLTLEHPEALATVQRFEADSKFFRSLVVVLCILIPWGLVQNRLVIALVSAPLLILAFWRYVDQRVKATNQAYWYIITLEGKRSGEPLKSSQPESDNVSHAGGVVFRLIDGKVQWLLVQTKKDPNKWVLPKGHINRGETMQEAAVREVREETGVWARIRGQLKTVEYTVNDELIRIQFYLMEAIEEDKPSDRRSHRWLPLDNALNEAEYAETRAQLSLAEQERAAL